MSRPGTRFFIGALTPTQQRRRKRARDDFRVVNEIADARNLPMADAFKVLHEYRKYGPPVVYSHASGNYP